MKHFNQLVLNQSLKATLKPADRIFVDLHFSKKIDRVSRHLLKNEIEHLQATSKTDLFIYFDIV